MSPNDHLVRCEQCGSQDHVENFQPCKERGCLVPLCSECRSEGAGYCEDHDYDHDPDSVPADWWAGGFAANH